MNIFPLGTHLPAHIQDHRLTWQLLLRWGFLRKGTGTAFGDDRHHRHTGQCNPKMRPNLGPFPSDQPDVKVKIRSFYKESPIRKKLAGHSYRATRYTYLKKITHNKNPRVLMIEIQSSAVEVCTVYLSHPLKVRMNPNHQHFGELSFPESKLYLPRGYAGKIIELSRYEPGLRSIGFVYLTVHHQELNES